MFQDAQLPTNVTVNHVNIQSENALEAACCLAFALAKAQQAAQMASNEPLKINATPVSTATDPLPSANDLPVGDRPRGS
jgi:hypothetical protein